MKFPMPGEYKHIRPIDTVWYGNPQLKEGLSVPEITIKYGSLSSRRSRTATKKKRED